MPVGNTVTQGNLNDQIGTCAVQMRDACAAAAKLWEYVTTLGSDEASQVSGLVTLGFNAGDAQTFWTKANNLYAVSQVYYGTLTQPSAFNYDSSLAAIRGLE